jgi:hypothetical protein
MPRTLEDEIKLLLDTYSTDGAVLEVLQAIKKEAGLIRIAFIGAPRSVQDYVEGSLNAINRHIASVNE